MAKKIYVIDDDKAITELLSNRLKSKGYDVVTACDGQDALRSIENEDPDLVIVDIKMPTINGFTFVKSMRKMEGFASKPLIVLTGYPEMKDLFAMEGIQNYLVKPFDPQELMEMIQGCIGAAEEPRHG